MNDRKSQSCSMLHADPCWPGQRWWRRWVRLRRWRLPKLKLWRCAQSLTFYRWRWCRCSADCALDFGLHGSCGFVNTPFVFLCSIPLSLCMQCMLGRVVWWTICLEFLWTEHDRGDLLMLFKTVVFGAKTTSCTAFFPFWRENLNSSLNETVLRAIKANSWKALSWYLLIGVQWVYLVYVNRVPFSRGNQLCLSSRKFKSCHSHVSCHLWLYNWNHVDILWDSQQFLALQRNLNQLNRLRLATRSVILDRLLSRAPKRMAQVA